VIQTLRALTNVWSQNIAKNILNKRYTVWHNIFPQKIQKYLFNTFQIRQFLQCLKYFGPKQCISQSNVFRHVLHQNISQCLQLKGRNYFFYIIIWSISMYGNISERESPILVAKEQTRYKNCVAREPLVIWLESTYTTSHNPTTTQLHVCNNNFPENWCHNIVHLESEGTQNPDNNPPPVHLLSSKFWSA